MAVQYIGTARLGTKQTASYTGTAGTISNGISTGVYKVRVLVTTDAYVYIGDGTAATSANGAYMVASSPEYFTCSPGQKVSAVQVSSGGTLDVVECA